MTVQRQHGPARFVFSEDGWLVWVDSGPHGRGCVSVCPSMSSRGPQLAGAHIADTRLTVEWM